MDGWTPHLIEDTNMMTTTNGWTLMLKSFFLSFISSSFVSSSSLSVSFSRLVQTAYRLLTITLLQDLEFVLICGPAPTLSECLGRLQAYITPTTNQFLHSCLFDFSRNLPIHFSFHHTVMGFVYLWQNKRIVCSYIPSIQHSHAHLFPHQSSGYSSPSAHHATHNHSSTSSSSSSSSSSTAVSSSTSSTNVSSSNQPIHSVQTTVSSNSSSPAQKSSNGSNLSHALSSLFSSSMLSEASLIARARCLREFYLHAQPQLFGVDDLTTFLEEPDDDDILNQPPSQNGISDSTHSLFSKLHTLDVSMCSQGRTFYATRNQQSNSSIYVMFSDKITSQQQQLITHELLNKMEVLCASWE